MKQYTRRTPQQWQVIIDQWHDSGLSASRFCEEMAVGYASFCNWRKRLAAERLPAPQYQRPEDATFIDLGTLSASSPGSGWSIVLSLGEGIELRLSRP
ncbi:IS66 family insertion sequence element accessory protein TnpA [Nitrincola sp. MINF-07-Sa-05]|uniref:IS66 family insertion sequence element accessory protein TnpA n=1 Tax=Nitrincola salilacus TaxID=3400273 RepID=UPI00391818A5